jgi:ribosomal protein S18 acetylase RimI-like enzyme
MLFELTEAIIDEILFAMEDHEGYFLLDTVDGVVSGILNDPDVSDEEIDAGDGEGGARYIDLPDWDSADGFRLMERFAAAFRSPLIREELSSALGLGKGVFRAFKDVLARHPEAEKFWFSFKEKEMKKEIWRWYNGLREEWGLEKIGAEPEDTDNLVLEDFCFRAFEEEDRFQAEALHRQCVEEFGENLAEANSSPDGSNSGIEIITRELYSFRNASGSSFGITAESLGGDFAGYISGTLKGTALYIQNLEVKSEYRGLGLGEALLVKFSNSLDQEKTKKVMLDLPSWTDGFSRVLLRESFKPYAVRYWRSL